MSEGLHVRRLVRGDRSRALECLRARPDENLSLIDYACRLDGTLGPGEVPPQLYGAFEGERIEAIVALRPSVVFSSGMTDDAQSVLMPLVIRVPSGLIKSEHTLVNSIWSALEAAGREAVIDRVEIAYRLRPEAILPADPELPGVARPAREEDLEDLIHAARASLWEENRPDPSEGDPLGFERWVRGRLPRARVVSENGRIVFVAYADVRSGEGWLVQGVYTWPDFRRRGFARRGMDSVVREAFACGAAHVQLAVVDGNERALNLYEALGFEAFGELRTILFH